MKKTLPVLIAIIFSLFLCSCAENSHSEVIDNFITYKEDFEIINNVLLNVEPQDNKSIYGIVFKEEKIMGIYELPIELDESQIASLNRIDDAFIMDFSQIEITENRISYGGLGNQMYVYSKDGKKPKYFYYEGDKVPFSVENLSGNWYLCYAKIR